MSIANGRLTHCAFSSVFQFWPIIAGGISHMESGVRSSYFQS